MYNMNKILSILILFMSLSSCSQEIKCSEFRTGEFRYLNENFPEKIIRTELSQIETNPETGVVIHTSIKWTSKCNYVMTYEKILNYSEDVNHMIGEKIYVEILETKGNKIKVHAKSKRIDTAFEFIKID